MKGSAIGAVFRVPHADHAGPIPGEHTFVFGGECDLQAQVIQGRERPELLAVLVPELVTRSRPVETSRPSLANRTAAAPPPWAPQLLTWVPFSISQSLTVPSSLAEARTFESGRQVMSVIAAVCPGRSKNSRPVCASQTIRPLLRSPVASRTPSGLNSTAVIQSVCFFDLDSSSWPSVVE